MQLKTRMRPQRHDEHRGKRRAAFAPIRHHSGIRNRVANSGSSRSYDAANSSRGARNSERGLQAAEAYAAPGSWEPAVAVVALCGINAALRCGCGFAALCSSRLCGPAAAARLHSYGLAVTMQSERGLQAAETCVLHWASEFPDSFFDALNGEWWYAFGLFGTVAVGGHFCGLKAALLSPSLHSYGLD